MQLEEIIYNIMQDADSVSPSSKEEADQDWWNYVYKDDDRHRESLDIIKLTKVRIVKCIIKKEINIALTSNDKYIQRMAELIKLFNANQYLRHRSLEWTKYVASRTQATIAELQETLNTCNKQIEKEVEINRLRELMT